MTVAAGTETWASTLATATAVPGTQPGPARPPRSRQPAGAIADRDDRRATSCRRRPSRSRARAPRRTTIGEAVGGRPDGLVAGRAVVPRLDAGQLPDHPVGGLDQPVGGPVDVGRLAQDLERLREEPLRRDLAAVALEPRLAELAGDAVDVVGLGLRGVMLPELDPRVRVAPVRVEEAQRRAVGRRREHRAGREVDADPDDLGRVDARAGDQASHGTVGTSRGSRRGPGAPSRGRGRRRRRARAGGHR